MTFITTRIYRTSETANNADDIFALLFGFGLLNNFHKTNKIVLMIKMDLKQLKCQVLRLFQ